jgi:hypothetical protein
MTLDEQFSCTELARSFGEAHDHAFTALANAGVGRFDAVVWISAHVMAADRALSPALRRLAPNAIGLLDAQSRADRDLQRAVRVLERICSGDTLAAQVDEGLVRRRVRTLLQAHAVHEQQIVDVLCAVMSNTDEQDLAKRYGHLFDHGTTRPHPHTPTRGPLASIVYSFDRMRDHMLDVMDSRTTPLQREATSHTTPGRWGLYVLGTMRDGDESSPPETAS